MKLAVAGITAAVLAFLLLGTYWWTTNGAHQAHTHCASHSQSESEEHDGHNHHEKGHSKMAANNEGATGDQKEGNTTNVESDPTDDFKLPQEKKPFKNNIKGKTGKRKCCH